MKGFFVGQSLKSTAVGANYGMPVATLSGGTGALIFEIWIIIEFNIIMSLHVATTVLTNCSSTVVQINAFAVSNLNLM